VQEGHRIRTAGHGHQDAFSAGQKRVPLHSPLDVRNQVRHELTLPRGTGCVKGAGSREQGAGRRGRLGRFGLKTDPGPATIRCGSGAETARQGRVRDAIDQA
jgi:hypothetical protein